MGKNIEEILDENFQAVEEESNKVLDEVKEQSEKEEVTISVDEVGSVEDILEIPTQPTGPQEEVKDINEVLWEENPVEELQETIKTTEETQTEENPVEELQETIKTTEETQTEKNPETTTEETQTETSNENLSDESKEGLQDEIDCNKLTEKPIDECVENLYSKTLRESREFAKSIGKSEVFETIVDCINKSHKFSYYHCGRLIRNGISIEKLKQFYNEFKTYGIQNKTEDTLLKALDEFISAIPENTEK